jgi:hypothetical protein
MVSSNEYITGLLIEDDENGLTRAIHAARSQSLTDECNCYTRNDISWTWVKNFTEFTQYIVKNGLPDVMAFDHDLSDDAYILWQKNLGYKKKNIDYDEYTEKTGYHCAKWLTEYCQDNNLKLTSDVFCHSMNPKGRENIKAILNNFKKFQDTYGVS